MLHLNPVRSLAVLVLVVDLFALRPLAAEGNIVPEFLSFNRDIRPILSEHCYACHGPDVGQRKAGLRLDREVDARRELASGVRAIVPGNTAKSELVQRIDASDPDDVMPPEEHGKPLSSQQKTLLRHWIDQGAQWEGHWAYLTPQRPDLPKNSDPSWARNPIDQFIKAKHDTLALPSSPEAPKTKLIRRASLDLTGLPPTVAEIDAFLADDSDESYDTLIDRLLESEHYGERQAMFWLDLARYGETQGFHHDRHRDMWHWRDWVIDAYNNNKPFNDFTIEQLAGDLLPDPTPDQLVATGFHRNEMTTSEGGALPEEYSVKYVVGRVDTTARVWLGTSLACAECHDHKYDPISQEDYYRFFSYFNNVPEDGLDRGVNPRPRLFLSSEEEDSRLQQLNQEHQALKTAHTQAVDVPSELDDQKQAQWVSDLTRDGLQAWEALKPTKLDTASESRLIVDADNTITADGPVPEKDTFTLEFQTNRMDLTGLRLEAIPLATAPHGKSGRSSEGDFILTGFLVEARSADSAPVFESWRRIGPFVTEAGAATPPDQIFGPETNLDFDSRHGPDELAWSSPQALEDLATLQPESPGVYYFATTFKADHAKTLTLSLPKSLGARIWLNWKALPTQEEIDENQASTFDLPLDQGQNRLLFKLHSSPETIRFSPLVTHPNQDFAPIKMKTAAASYERPRYGIRGTLDDKIETGWSVWGKERQGEDREYAWFQPESPVGFEGGTTLRVTLAFNSPLKQRLMAKFRLAVTDSNVVNDVIELPQNIRAELVKLADERTDKLPRSVQVYYRESFVETAKQLKKLLDEKRKERDNYRNSLPVAMVMDEQQERKDTFMLIRGEYNNPGKKVTPGIPSALFPNATDAVQNRLDLAKWLVHPDHPLTSRVIVNHYWQQFFGTGIVKTSEDFGSQGEWPSHPGLIDWLAKEFVESGWDIKHLHRLIVTSATYRQEATILPVHLAKDPENRYLARFPRLRLEAEAIRDLAMAASGLLDPSVGGPSIYPYQPPGIWEQVSFQGTRKWTQSEGAKNYRRGLYVYWRRSVPYASFVTFDAPSRETCTVKRPRTNTPLQALVMMNDPVYVEAARALGQRILEQEATDLNERLRFAFRLTLARPPTARELSELRQTFQVELKHFESHRAAANQLIHVGSSEPPLDTDICELAAWTVIGNILLNLDETITKG